MKSRSLRVLAVTGAAAVASATMFGGAAAQAQGAGNIDFSQSGSLTVHKYLQQSGSAEGDVTGQTPPGFDDPVAGVGFTAYPLLMDGDPVDLQDNAAWTELGGTTAGANCSAPSGYTLGTPVPLPETNSAGEATVTLPLTAYQVCETSAPANILDRAAPFIITVPMAHEGNWVYDVHAYPKNSEGDVSKTVTSPDELGIGATVTWPVTSTVPVLSGEAWTGYSVTDTMDDRLDPVGVSSVTLNGSVFPESNYDVNIEGQTVIMELNQTGLDALEALGAPGSLVTNFTSTVNSVDDGAIDNSASLWVNNPDRDASIRPPLDTDPNDPAVSNWGSLELSKQDAESDNALAGAEFEVYAADDPYAADCSAVEATGDAISVDGATTFTSGDDGIVTIPGLFVSDNASTPVDDPDRCYVVREITAPTGYVLPDDADTPVAVEIGLTSASIAIPNTQQAGNVPDLPLTGGAGTGAMIGLGAVFVLGAGGLALAKRRNDEDQEVTASA